ncbi:uncharacterized protein FIBRA_09413 [Fibroporia radiculosa]|uniref:Uncharacterized protein n=1 Tax=Fibroporia radiculosa TaxID=599839 RepID=J7RHL3_9APHY|nr:uncharacterized protein FIBRA_09413 [Fibroporia radiculosa]CCM07087.1 predicted protein [Fibroporia radiculosa]
MLQIDVNLAYRNNRHFLSSSDSDVLNSALLWTNSTTQILASLNFLLSRKDAGVCTALLARIVVAFLVWMMLM